VTDRIDILRDLEQELGILVRRVRRVIGERARTVDPDLHPASYLLLAHLVHCGPSRASELAHVFDLDKGAVSRQVQHLAELGLVARAPDPEDGRATLVEATDAAMQRMEDVAAARRQRLAEQLTDWTAADLEQLVGLLGRYNRTLERD
jgi:DNA-binding MarR family transcriptional regulator